LRRQTIRAQRLGNPLRIGFCGPYFDLYMTPSSHRFSLRVFFRQSHFLFVVRLFCCLAKPAFFNYSMKSAGAHPKMLFVYRFFCCRRGNPVDSL
jgi:hypothetical protein